MLNSTEIIKELKFKAIKSSGAGGQHVNKTSSKIELTFNLQNTNVLSKEEIQLLKLKLSSKLTKHNLLILYCEESRSQHKNKELVIKRFLKLIKLNLIRPKKRKPTKPTKGSIKRKADDKKRISAKKTLRKKPKFD